MLVSLPAQPLPQDDIKTEQLSNPNNTEHTLPAFAVCFPSAFFDFNADFKTFDFTVHLVAFDFTDFAAFSFTTVGSVGFSTSCTTGFGVIFGLTVGFMAFGFTCLATSLALHFAMLAFTGTLFSCPFAGLRMLVVPPMALRGSRWLQQMSSGPPAAVSGHESHPDWPQTPSASLPAPLPVQAVPHPQAHVHLAPAFKALMASKPARS